MAAETTAAGGARSKKVRRPQAQKATTPTYAGSRKRTPRPDDRPDSHPALGERITFDCPVCDGGNADATYRQTRYGVPDWLIDCFRCRTLLDGAYLPALCDALGLPSNAEKEDIASALRSLGHSSRRAGGTPAPLPSRAAFDGWAARLLTSPEPLRWLTDERGVSLDVIERARIGYDATGRRLTFPFYAGHELVAAKWRLPRTGHRVNMRDFPGRDRPAPLYPAWMLPERGPVVLVAGELDALAGLSAGLAAVSVARGAGVWRDRWTETLRGRRVLVCFDNNEGAQARAAVERLRAAGIRARRLDLRKLGLRRAKGDLSDYLRAGLPLRPLTRYPKAAA